MVRFEIENREIELAEYTEDVTLPVLVAELEDFRLKNRLKTRKCKGCGECCSDNIPVLGLDLAALTQGLQTDMEELKSRYLILPEPPNLKFRRKAVDEMVRMNGLASLEAALIYEYNNAEPIIVAKREGGACLLLQNNLCSMYTHRPYSCGLYLCNMGSRLSYLQEMIIRQGTWHAYHLLGWIPEEEIAHNPFLKAHSYQDLRVRDFEFGFDNALEKLFFYF